jgi:hypothetical protein
MKAMLDSLQHSPRNPHAQQPTMTPSASKYHEDPFEGGNEYHGPTQRISLEDTTRFPTGAYDQHSDLFGSISEKQAIELFEAFCNSVLPQYPILALSTNQTFHSLHSTQPVLLLAMITAASGTLQAGLFKTLHSRLVRELAEKAIIDGQRSIELIQAAILLKTWYCPPDDLRKLNFYQWTHIAGTMAMQIGLGGITLSKSTEGMLIGTDQEAERFRTMFAVFEGCSS